MAIRYLGEAMGAQYAANSTTEGQVTIHIQPENIKPSFRKIQPDPITNQLSKTKTSKN